MKQKIISITKEAIVQKYKPKLGFFETEKAIKLVKDVFEQKLAEKLKLQRVSAPKFLITGTGLQDDLAGTQTPVSFKTKFTEKPVEIVHSLAKWKRQALGKYGFSKGTGLYTDMDAIRKDENISPIHSIYVDQWDWEKVISKQEKKLSFLKRTVKDIYSAILETAEIIKEAFPSLQTKFPKEISFLHAKDLEAMFPEKTPKEREYFAAKKLGAFFLIGIGGALKSGKPHDIRAADYDDWTLDGDIIIWDCVRKDALELSSMGIRVDAKKLVEQLDIMDLGERKEMPFQKGIIDGTIPLSIGGGIGQSRLCMLLLQKAHIGEVQSSVWPKEVVKEFEEKKIPLL